MVKIHPYKIVWDNNALTDFKDILNYLSKRSEHAPKIIKNAILDRLEIIKTNPLICESDKLRSKPNDSFRAFIVYSYRITYQIKTEIKEIRIIRVRHTSREPLGYE
jgi:addiction module RelE/StbE family toxin